MIKSKAFTDVLAERRRQVLEEGYDSDHDDIYTGDELPKAAAAYAMACVTVVGRDVTVPPDYWPWSWEFWKPGDRRRMLVKAAALLLAEIDRLDRKAEKEESA